MVRLVVLGEDGEEDVPFIEQNGASGKGRLNPNMNQFTAALSCYP